VISPQQAVHRPRIGVDRGTAVQFRTFPAQPGQRALGVAQTWPADHQLANLLTAGDRDLKQTQFSTAVEMLKDAIPPKLLILDGRNPLTLLYRPLSAQLHDLTDEECLQQAADIRLVLNESFDNIGRVLRDEEELRGAVNRLQDI
jgi:hypothetical protein